jgi:predicted ATPase
VFILVNFDKDEEEVNNKARNLQTFIKNHSGKLIQTVEDHKNAYMDVIEKYRRNYKQS